MTDQEIFEGIVQKDNRVFRYLYQEHRGKILNMVLKNNGNEEDALDIFQEGLLCLWTNIQSGKYQLQSQTKLSSYLFTICRNLWISKLRKLKPSLSIENQQLAEPVEEGNSEEEKYERLKQLEQTFKKLDEACRKMLSSFYYQKLSLKAIAENMGITEKSAKNNKYRCMKKLRSLY
ncbi:MAG: sigma-70 family RNA polymerase sigma factor [Bacteroidia bacterium]|nr:sigma-70 family RNA polymerase sigma factor [Bacteroidia bacterium]